MNKKRLKGYESPTTELIELRVESVICVSGGGNIDGITEDNFGDLDSFIS